jgi:hypothetical protein
MRSVAARTSIVVLTWHPTPYSLPTREGKGDDDGEEKVVCGAVARSGNLASISDFELVGCDGVDPCSSEDSIFSSGTA